MLVGCFHCWIHCYGCPAKWQSSNAYSILTEVGYSVARLPEDSCQFHKVGRLTKKAQSPTVICAIPLFLSVSGNSHICHLGVSQFSALRESCFHGKRVDESQMTPSCMYFPTCSGSWSTVLNLATGNKVDSQDYLQRLKLVLTKMFIMHTHNDSHNLHSLWWYFFFHVIFVVLWSVLYWSLLKMENE